MPATRVCITGYAARSCTPRISVPSSRRSSMRDLRNKAPERYTPGLNTTTPLPAFAAASMAFWMAAVSSVLPSPLAPYAVTSNAAARSCAGAMHSAIISSGIEGLMRTIINTSPHCVELKWVQANMKHLIPLLLLSLSATAGNAAGRKVLVYTPPNLNQYQALVFSNSNNEAFANQAQRDAFKAYMESGGGFVGIHSASGSERDWPYFWSVAGGRFQRHPAFQKFVVRVKDPNHASTKHLPASFEWEDECYFLEYLNPDLHPLLVTDPAKLKDPERAKYPRDLVGDSMPLAW